MFPKAAKGGRQNALQNARQNADVPDAGGEDYLVGAPNSYVNNIGTPVDKMPSPGRAGIIGDPVLSPPRDMPVRMPQQFDLPIRPEGSGGFQEMRKGGAQDDESPTEIMAAHGELITPPAIVRLWGGGDMKKGHDLFDQAVLHFRQKHINDLKGLKGPKKS
jgi:hypothetical protein